MTRNTLDAFAWFAGSDTPSALNDHKGTGTVNMKITPYNLHAAIEMLRGRAFLLLMSTEVNDIYGPRAAPLWDIVGDMTEAEAEAAISAFNATQ